MQRRYAALATTVVLALSGCGNMLDRPAPTRDGYIEGYFEFFDVSQIDKLDFAWKGAIGGIMTTGRAHFKGSVRLRDVMVDARIKAGRITTETYDPSKLTEVELWAFKNRCLVPAGGKTPAWLDFPFDRKMRTIEEANKEDPDAPSCPFQRTWYIDDEHNVVYVLASWG
jgi:hypothetical protein